MKRMLLIAALMLALVLAAVACTGGQTLEGTTAGQTTAADTSAATTAEEAKDTIDEPATNETATEPAPAETTAEPPVETTAEPVTTAPEETTYEETTRRVVTADPEPVLDFDPVTIKDACGGGISTQMMNENGIEFVRMVMLNDDPNCFLLNDANLPDMPNYMAFVYRTDCDQVGEMFIGSIGSPTGAGDRIHWNYINDEKWHVLIINLATVDITSYRGNVLNYIRYDPMLRRPSVQTMYLDVAYIGFFNAPECALAYAYDMFYTPVVGDDAASVAGKVNDSAAASEVTTEQDRTFVRLTTTGDAPGALLQTGLNQRLNYLTVSYRTNSASNGRFLVGAGEGPTGQGDVIPMDWNGDGEWHLEVIDLTKVAGLTSVKNRIVDYLQLDFFTDAGAEGDYFDIEYVGFFTSKEAAYTYYNDLHGTQVEIPPEDSDPDPEPTPEPEPETQAPTPAPDEPAKPEAPTTSVAVSNANDLASKGSTIGNQMSASAVTTENDRTFVRLTATGGDPFFPVMGSANIKAGFLAISYRTNAACEGQFFLGSGGGATGSGDYFNVDWNQDGEWHLMIIDLSTVKGLTSIKNGIINYLRFDFFVNQGAEGDYIDVEFIGFFTSAESAEDYNNSLHDN